MKFFALFMIGTFTLGILLYNKSPQLRLIVILGVTVFVCIGYYFLKQI